MSAVTYEKLQLASLTVDYTGIDRSATVLATAAGGSRECGGAGKHPRPSLRHGDVRRCVREALLEHLPYYETAVREMFRVARDSVVISLFQVPAEPERLLRRETGDGYIWLNRYAPGSLRRCCIR